jgi:heavy metal sensor kinase
MNPRSLRFRLTLWHAGLLTGVFLLCGSAIYQVLGLYLKENLAQSLHRRIQQITLSLLPEIEKTGEQYVIDEIKARYAPENYDRFIRLTRPGGAVIYASGRAASFDPTGLPPATGDDAKRVATLPDGNRLLMATEVYRTSSGRTYILESGGPLQPIDNVLKQLLFLLLLGVPVVVLVAVAGGYVLVGQALAPVVQIARSAELITLHSLDERLPIAPTGDELEQLSLALNRMISRLRESFQQSQRFLADASHELRTPLTALRGELEHAVEQASPLPELRDKIGSALEEVDRLAKIVQTLLAISRLDAGEAQKEWQHFDLARLAADTAGQMYLLAEDKGISFNCNVEREAGVEGDRARIKQVVVNLLDNAIKYTPSGGSVHLNVRVEDGHAILEVIDTGIGIPPAALPHVFDRFFRVDDARSRDAGGAGLGLAIVKSICTAHGGRVEVESTEGKGSRFILNLPLAPVPALKTNV